MGNSWKVPRAPPATAVHPLVYVGRVSGGGWVVQLLLNAVFAAVPAKRIELEVDPCLSPTYGIDVGILREAVEIEALGESLPDGASIAVSCGPEGARLHRSAPVSVPDRTLVLDSVAPAVRARVLALAIVELAVQAAPPPAPAEQVPPAPKPPEPPVPHQPLFQPAWQLNVGASGRLFGRSTWLAGGGLGVAHHPRPHLGWSGSINVEGAQYASELGSISVFSVSGAVRLLGYDDLSRTVRLSGGVGVAAGWSQLWGHAEDNVLGARLHGVWLGPVGDLRLELSLTPRWLLGLQAELGYAAVGVRALAGSETIANLDGLWLGGNLYVGWKLPRRR